ncbi:MAG: efflux RND transporter periplasmic adaptor subunit [Solirubrobacteraceae bacterium]
MHTMPRFAVCLLAVAGLAGCSRHPAPAPPPRIVLVQTVGADVAAFAETYSGTVHARFEPELAFRVAGKIVARRAHLGEAVKKGQILAVLDARDAELALASARAALGAAQSQLTYATRQRDRFADLRRRGLVSQAYFDQREDAYKSASAVAKQSQQSVAIAQQQVDYTTLHADADGVITAVDAEAGQVVAAGQPVFGFAEAGALDVQIAVPENRVDAFRAARDISVTLDALPGVHARAALREIAAAADPASRTYLAKLALVQPDPRIALGMTAEAHVQGVAPGAALVPAQAIFHDGLQPAVWVVDPADSTVHLRPVVIERYLDAGALLRTPLAPGTRIVVRGVQMLHAGEKVDPQPLAAAAERLP